jgi:hypothetical protein
LEPKVFSDARGFFFESINQRDFAEKRVLTCPLCRTATANSCKASQNRQARGRLNAADTLLAKGPEGWGKAMRDATK